MNMNLSENEPEPQQEKVNSELSKMKIVESSEILQGEVEVMIHHNETLYRLRQTKAGKLILQK